MSYRSDVSAIVCIVLGIPLFLWPDWFAGKARERRERRLAELESGAEERIFEEKRSLLAYPPPAGRPWGRACGAALVILGAATLYFARASG